MRLSGLETLADESHIPFKCRAVHTTPCTQYQQWIRGGTSLGLLVPVLLASCHRQSNVDNVSCRPFDCLPNGNVTITRFEDAAGAAQVLVGSAGTAGCCPDQCGRLNLGLVPGRRCKMSQNEMLLIVLAHHVPEPDAAL